MEKLGAGGRSYNKVCKIQGSSKQASGRTGLNHVYHAGFQNPLLSQRKADLKES
jgi:hypothetical protein